MNEIIQKAKDSFDKKFGETLTEAANEKIKAFLEKTLTSAITKAFEEVKVEKKGEVITIYGSQNPEWQFKAHMMKSEHEGFNAALTEVEAKQANFLKQ